VCPDPLLALVQIPERIVGRANRQIPQEPEESRFLRVLLRDLGQRARRNTPRQGTGGGARLAVPSDESWGRRLALDVSIVFFAIAFVFVGLAAWDRQSSREPSPKRRIWLTLAGIFAAVATALRVWV
jgi:hypothetical protein